jgi:hypothetical protein
MNTPIENIEKQIGYIVSRMSTLQTCGTRMLIAMKDNHTTPPSFEWVDKEVEATYNQEGEILQHLQAQRMKYYASRRSESMRRTNNAD